MQVKLDKDSTSSIYHLSHQIMNIIVIHAQYDMLTLGVPCFHHLHMICSNCCCMFKKLSLTWSIFITCSRWTPINKPLKSAICTRTLKTPLQLDNSACKQTPLWQVHQMYRLQWFLNFLCFTL